MVGDWWLQASKRYEFIYTDVPIGFRRDGFDPVLRERSCDLDLAVVPLDDLKRRTIENELHQASILNADGDSMLV